MSISIIDIIEGSLEVKLPTIWTDEKQRWEESEKRREEDRESLRRKKIQVREKSQKKEGGRKGRKVAKHCVFPMICGSGGSTSRLARAAGAEPAGQMRDEKLHILHAVVVGRPLLEVEMLEKCTPLWREAHFEVKSAKNLRVRSTFGRSDVLSRGRRKGLCTVSKVSKT